ncbi:MAG: bifunctional phosphoglucose/phosphomannose isomerase [Candidatus Omnitrophica bacterium]|nr:bifunctional phosphoglucose/phosphomannose isomerase [Candidatus Omnitrophota bacterium]MBU1047556.1 bifunctional phosphoglucose/phosphomannose isomerase [Candidatus Omnitrophota bacterium]MBU1630932.1 bifunctional phosphoglucose/phosphomannose isomerase [Candidatus Omnitrophota bacterium]MBU1767380.1 bifunctional phosphoglucose/phosphomannose isomerase [Candidatus Omnitrophota bacterium]MBU1888919.1 bifunctional phosphoglucose/phosphomannose isomerase [Candidatus Omnitrophota bacterium]
MNNVDDTKTIEKFDQSKMRKLLYEFPHQGEKMIELMKDINIPSEYKNVKNIIVSGLGGSSVGGDLLKNFLRDKIKLPLIVNRSYTLPRWVGKDTLLICVSYSGNTEETLNTYQVAKEAKSKIIVISSGGELAQLAKKDGFACIPVPEVGIPPRTALGYLFFSQLFIIKMLGFADIEDSEFSEAIQTLKDLREEIDIDIPKDKNISKQLAEEIYQTIPLVYTTSDYLEGVGIRWKTQINENSKSPVYCEFFPELNHNEIMGWEGGKELVGKFSLILLRDKEESERMLKRIGITLSLIEDNVSKMLEVHSRGDKLLSRILSLVYIGDYVSFYLAILNDVDPTEIKFISSLKKSLSK